MTARRFAPNDPLSGREPMLPELVQRAGFPILRRNADEIQLHDTVRWIANPFHAGIGTVLNLFEKGLNRVAVLAVGDGRTRTELPIEQLVFIHRPTGQYRCVQQSMIRREHPIVTKTSVCHKCGEIFSYEVYACGPMRAYCDDDCRDEAQREQSRERMRQMRARRRAQEAVNAAGTASDQTRETYRLPRRHRSNQRSRGGSAET
jgi:hypothetical protein